VSDPVAGDGESPVELDGPTREVAVESAADEVLVCAGVGGVVHLGRVLVARRRPLPPGAYLANPAPCLALVAHHGVVGEQRHHGFGVAASVRFEVARDDVRYRAGHDGPPRHWW